ncbi:MAG: helicase [Pseudomonadales bacterium]|nr:helicase [Pseudomonadales bacterium]
MIGQIIFWLRKIHLHLMLWEVGRKLIKKCENEAEFKKLLDGKDVVLQFETEDKMVSRHYVIKDQLIASILGPHPEPTTTLSFVDAAYAITTLKNKDPMDLMKGVQEQKIKPSGDLANLMWFVSAAQASK